MCVIAFFGVLACTDIANTRRLGSWMPSMYVGPGIFNNFSMSFFFVEIFTELPVNLAVVDLH
jgi:hypothetical protein